VSRDPEQHRGLRTILRHTLRPGSDDRPQTVKHPTFTALATVVLASCRCAPCPLVAPEVPVNVTPTSEALLPPEPPPSAAVSTPTAPAGAQAPHTPEAAWREGIVADTDDALARSAMIAVAVLQASQQECSGMGGFHGIFRLIHVARGSGVSLAHYGGHGFYPAAVPRAGEVFVVGVEPSHGPIVLHDPGWCLQGLPAAQGRVVALQRAADAPTAIAHSDALAARRPGNTTSAPRGP
jgi:hypothetical protein